MFDGYDSCSEDTSSSSSSEESEEEVAPLPSNLPIIKNNGQVYTYPDGKSGMGECSQPSSVPRLVSELLYQFHFFGHFPSFEFFQGKKKHSLKLTVADKISVWSLFLPTCRILAEGM